MYEKTKGNNAFQHRAINWSYLNLGNDALTQINKKTTIITLNPKVKESSNLSKNNTQE